MNQSVILREYRARVKFLINTGRSSIQTSRGFSQTTDYWNKFTTGWYIMGSNVSRSILSIIALVALIELIMICGPVPFVMGSIMSCLILLYQPNRIQPRWNVPIHSKLIPFHWLIQLNVVVERGKKGSAIQKQYLKTQILKWSCIIEHTYNVLESQRVWSKNYRNWSTVIFCAQNKNRWNIHIRLKECCRWLT